MTTPDGFDRTTAAIVRLEEKVSRLESDFKEMKAEVKSELSEIKNMLLTINTTMTLEKGAIEASKFWIGAFAGLISTVVSIGVAILLKVFIK